ncbi:MAG: hypothetical protein WBB29_07565, partial [Geitlerinemataceae cyanobacterium]
MLNFDLFEGYRIKPFKESTDDDDPLGKVGTLVNGFLVRYPKTENYLIIACWMTSTPSESKIISVGDPHPKSLSQLLGPRKEVGWHFASEIKREGTDAQQISKGIEKLSAKPLYLYRKKLTPYQKRRRRPSDRYKGVVAVGAQLQFGLDRSRYYLFWLAPPHWVNCFETLEDLLSIHGHWDPEAEDYCNEVRFGLPDRTTDILVEDPCFHPTFSRIRCTLEPSQSLEATSTVH